jgi:glycosyltransferase involved in cell wall biosynthesis
VFGVPELIEDGRTGYLCEMRDAADLCAGLDRILSAPAGEIAAVTRAAETYARARHDPRVYAAKMAALITELAVAPPVGLPSRSMPRSARG